MSHKNIHLKDSSDFLVFHPENLSKNVIVEVESNLIDYSVIQIDRQTQTFLVWITLFGVIIWALYEVSFKLQLPKARDREIFCFSKTPCRKCKFYANNAYVKCAVNPLVVHTKQANNCRDYENRAI